MKFSINEEHAEIGRYWAHSNKETYYDIWAYNDGLVSALVRVGNTIKQKKFSSFEEAEMWIESEVCK